MLDDHFWQEVLQKKIEEDDLGEESFSDPDEMVSHRSMCSQPHRSTQIDEYRSIESFRERSMPIESTVACNAIRIMSHEEFARRHPHPPTLFYSNIDRQAHMPIDLREQSQNDRYVTAQNDRCTPSDIDRPNTKTCLVQTKPTSLSTPCNQNQDNLSNHTIEPLDVGKSSTERTLRRRKEKIPKHLKREPNDKEMDGFTKRVLRIPLDKPFEEVYYTHRLWMFFRETRVDEEGIEKLFNQVRKMMQPKVILQKKNDPGKFAIPCLVKGIKFPHALCDTGASVSILPKVMADQLGLNIEPSQDSFTFVDCSERKSGGIIRDLEVQIGNTLIPVDFHVLDIKLNWNSSLLLGRAFMATVGAVCDMNTNKFCLTLVDPNVFYDPVCVVKRQVQVKETKDNGLIAVCHCKDEYETEYSESIDTHLSESIDSADPNATDAHADISIDVHQMKATLPDHCYPTFASRHPSINKDDYSIGSWADSGFHGGYAEDNASMPDSQDMNQEYDECHKEDYTREVHAIITEDILQEQVIRTKHSKSIDAYNTESIDLATHHAAYQPTSIDAPQYTSIDMEARELKIYGNVPISIRAQDDYIRSHKHKRTSRIKKASNIQASTPFQRQTKAALNPRSIFRKTSSASYNMSANNYYRTTSMDALPTATTTSNPNSQELFKDYYSDEFLKPDEFGVFRDPDGHARAMDGRILQVSKDDIADILQMANGPENLFQNQMGVLKQTSIDTGRFASIDINEATSTDCKRCAAIDVKRFREKMFGPELYTKDETNEMLRCMSDCQERYVAKLNNDLDNTYTVLQDSITGLSFRIKEFETKLAAAEAKSPEKASTSIDVGHCTSIDMNYPHAQETFKKTDDPWEEAYLNSKISEVYYPLNNNVNWLSTKIELLQKDLDVFREEKNRQKRSTSIDTTSPVSIDAGGALAEKFYTREEVDKIIAQVYEALQTTEDRLDRRCNDIFFPFDNSIHALQLGADWLQNELRTVQTQLTCRVTPSKSIDAPYYASIDVPQTNAIDVASVEAVDADNVPDTSRFKQDLAAHAYDKIEWHTINIESLNERLQNISDTIVRMDERWARSDEATRSFMAAWFKDDRDKVDASFPTRSCLFTD